jgi:alpha-L-fucosidase
LNIGPTPAGDVPDPYDKILLETGAWLQKYGPAVYEATDQLKSLNLDPSWSWTGQITGDFTVNGSTVYFHVNRWPGTTVAIGALRNKVLSARLMGGPDIRFSQAGDRVLLHDLPETAPDPLATVIELTVEGVPAAARGHGYVVPQDPPGALAWG